MRFLLGDVRDRERLDRAFNDINIVFHAAALKHVHFCETTLKLPSRILIIIKKQVEKTPNLFPTSILSTDKSHQSLDQLHRSIPPRRRILT